MSIQSQVLNLLDDLQQEFGLTYLFIAHNLAVVEHISDRVGVMYLGRMVELADVDALYTNPRHPYTVALLSAVPNPTRGSARSASSSRATSRRRPNPPSGCRFHTRCWLRERLGNPEHCATEDPDVPRTSATGHQVACHLAEEMNDGGSRGQGGAGDHAARPGREGRPPGKRPGARPGGGRRGADPHPAHGSPEGIAAHLIGVRPGALRAAARDRVSRPCRA